MLKIEVNDEKTVVTGKGTKAELYAEICVVLQKFYEGFGDEEDKEAFITSLKILLDCKFDSEKVRKQTLERMLNESK